MSSKNLYIIAGPNGSGKTTFAREFLPAYANCPNFVNADLFAQAFGLAFYFKDANYNSVGAFYLENTYVQGHQFSISSGSVMIMEGVSCQYDRIVPIQLINGP